VTKPSRAKPAGGLSERSLHIDKKALTKAIATASATTAMALAIGVLR
jgi:hypothetical protein